MFEVGDGSHQNGEAKHDQQATKAERQREFSGSYRNEWCRQKGDKETDTSPQQACAEAYQPVPSGESKVSLFFVGPFAGPEGYIASANGVVESGERIGRLRLLLLLLLLLRVILDAVGPSELGKVGPECLLGGRLVGCHGLLVLGR